MATQEEIESCFPLNEGENHLRLRKLAREKGLLDSATRKRIWPLLLGIDADTMRRDTQELNEYTIVHTEATSLMEEYRVEHMKYLAACRRNEATREKANSLNFDDPARFELVEEEVRIPQVPSNLPTKYWDQVSKDVDRSLWKQVPEENERNAKRLELHRMITAVISLATDDKGRELHYFQGFHDIAAVCLLTCGEPVGYSVLKRLSTTYIRDHMHTKIDNVVLLLNVLFPIVSSIDYRLGAFLEKSTVKPHAALPWVMTWFSHVLENQPISERLFDLFLASPTWMPLYVAASLVVYMSSEGLYSCPCEFSEIHNFVSKFCSRTDIPWEIIIKDAIRYYGLFSPPYVAADSHLPTDAYVLAYPFPWVPSNEIIAPPLGLFGSLYANKALLKPAIGAFLVASVVTLGIVWAMSKR